MVSFLVDFGTWALILSGGKDSEIGYTGGGGERGSTLEGLWDCLKIFPYPSVLYPSFIEVSYLHKSIRANNLVN